MPIKTHPHNKEIAIVSTDEEFSAAARDMNFKAVIHDGFEHQEFDAYFNALSGEEKSSLMVNLQNLSEDTYKTALESNFPPVMAQTFEKLHQLFQSTTSSNESNFKLFRPASTKPHPHFTSNMIFPLGEAEGTCFEGGQAEKGRPFLIKPGFVHWTPPETKNTERQIVVFSNEFKLPY